MTALDSLDLKKKKVDDRQYTPKFALTQTSTFVYSPLAYPTRYEAIERATDETPRPEHHDTWTRQQLCPCLDGSFCERHGSDRIWVDGEGWPSTQFCQFVSTSIRFHIWLVCKHFSEWQVRPRKV